MDYLSNHAVEIFAAIGGLYTILRTIVLLTPTPADDQVLKVANTFLGKLFGIIAKLGGLDTTQGITTKNPPTKITEKTTVILLYSLILGACVGCSAFDTLKKDPRAELLAYEKMYTQSVTVLVDLKKAGVFNERQQGAITLLVNSGASYLVLWDEAVKANGERPELADTAIIIIKSLAEYTATEKLE